MAIQLFINDILIPDADVISLAKTDQNLSYGDKLIAATSEVILNNAGGLYDDMLSTSVFYGNSWYDMSYKTFDTATENYIFVGKIKNLVVNTTNMTVTVKSVNYMRDIFTKVCSNTSSNLTPAKIIWDILLYAGIPSTYINGSSFTKVIAYQTSVSTALTVYTNYTSQNNVKCSDVINELCRICQCGLYTINNVIFIYQWKEYAGETGFEIKDKIIAGSVSTEYGDEIYNKYSVAYKSGANVVYTTGTYAGTTLDLTGSIPDKKMTTTIASDFNILCADLSSATHAGQWLIQRNFCSKKYISFSTTYEFAYINIGDNIDFTYDSYYREPIEITSIKADSNKRVIQFTGVFRNLPVQRYARDLTIPDGCELYIVPSGTHHVVKFSISEDIDFSHYRLYFGTDPSLMESTICVGGVSPLDIFTNEVALGGYNIYRMYGILYDTPYYFQASCVDESGNESVKSDIITAVLPSVYYPVKRVLTTGETRTITTGEDRTDSEVYY